MKKGHQSCFSREQREAIVREYLTSDMSRRELAEKYRLDSDNIISVWVKRYGYDEKSLSLQPQTINPPVGMKKKVSPYEGMDVEELRRLLEEKDRLLHHKDMQLLALNTLIDVAEEHGIHVRKNSGAKQ